MINAFNLQEFGKAPDITMLTFQDFFFQLSMMAQSVFKWEGLPNGIDEKHLERYLFNEGRCMFFKNPETGWIITKCTNSGGLNINDEPTAIRPVTSGSEFIECTEKAPGENCVLIYNNDYAYPTYRSVLLRSARLTEMQRTIDINIHAQKTPVIIACSDKTRLSAKQVYKQWTGFEPLIVTDKTMDQIGMEMKVLNVAAPVVFDKLAIEKNRYWNECMTFLGINNANMDKRERLVDDEVQANNEQVGLCADAMLKNRQKAAKEMSEMCGCNITVKLRSHQQPVQGAGRPELKPGEEGGQNDES